MSSNSSMGACLGMVMERKKELNKLSIARKPFKYLRQGECRINFRAQSDRTRSACGGDKTGAHLAHPILYRSMVMPT